MNISIFAKKTFLNISPNTAFDGKPRNRGHLMRVSSMIRGDQIAERIGAKLNPDTGYEDDVCIYVKPMVRKGNDIKLSGKPFIDIVDGHNLGQLALKHPEAKIMTCSVKDTEIMRSVIPNEVIFIPQHHCNFDRVPRVLKNIETVGVIGTRDAFPLIPDEVKEFVRSKGIKFLEYSKFFSRQDIIDFYMKIDLQLVWRPYKKLLSNPLKIVNASSFGIPTVALDEPTFREVAGCYLPVEDANGFKKVLEGIVESRNMYEDCSRKCLEVSENYHIDKVGNLYKELLWI